MTRASLLSLSVLALALAGCPETNPDDFPAPPEPCADLTTPEGYVQALKCDEFKSCAFNCPGGQCSEPGQPYQCPAMLPWNGVVHADTCGDFDGQTYPDPVQGKCTASSPSDGALNIIGLDPKIPNRWHLPDGHFIQPAGHDQVIHPDDVTSAFLVDEILIPGTRFVVAVDAGVQDNALYAVDLDELAGDIPALVSHVRFAAPEQLDYGLTFVAPNEVYVSGAGNGKIFAFTIDLTSGALARDDAKDIDLGEASLSNALSRWYAGGVITTNDPNKLLVVPSTQESQLRLVDLTQKNFTGIDLSPAHEFFGIFPDTNDTTGNTYLITTYDTRQILRVDLAQQKVTATYPTGKNPEGLVVTPNFYIVANSDDDTIQVINPIDGMTQQTLNIKSDGVTGAQPGVLAFDATRNRVYATLSGINAIDVYNYNPNLTSPLQPLGRVPTSWWPTSIRLRADGSLVVTSAKGHGTGPAANGANTPDLTRGAIAIIPSPTFADLSTSNGIVTVSRVTNAMGGYPTVSCPSPKSYDFPVPSTNAGVPSDLIKYVLYVVRENKTFDSIFGDMPGVNGDPNNVLSPGRMDEIWANARRLAKTFTNFDDYGIDAEQSLQGHIWTSYGRSTDYIERVWSSTWGRNVRLPRAGLDSNFGAPAEGSLFVWADRNALDYEDMGEVVGIGAKGFDPNYPGLVFSQTVPDENKACYISARMRALCDLKPLTYVVLPCDHTYGNDEGRPTVETMIANNDVATGMIADAFSHSPFWQNGLLIVTEDDPQTGSDHVDAHRTPLFMVSPWIRRNYVSHTEIGTASIHKLIAHIFAKPYQSESVVNAAIPYDAFTGTPDYTPYTYSPLQTPVACNPSKDISAGPKRNYSIPDQVPELGREVEQRLKQISK